MYKKVELKDGFVGMENDVAKLWKEKDIVKKNFAMNEGKRYFTFYDGPPTANGRPTCWTYRNKGNERYYTKIQSNERLQSIKKSWLGYTWTSS